MGLFSTSNITCNERPSVGRNFRDTINESASPINRFTEKAETRSFDEIFYEADIAIREASNSMNKLWYKSVLESDTVESAIINEANIFSKIVEVIKNIFERVKKALSAVAKKVREFFVKIFKKKDKEGTENTNSDGKETRGTSKESTPTSSSEETTEKVTKAVDDVEKLEKEKKELEKELEKAKKEEENKKKEEDGKKKEEENKKKEEENKKKEDEKKAESDKDEPKKKAESDKNSDSIDTKNIDTSSLDKPKNKPKANNDMDSISVPDTSKLESINKKIEEKNKAIENKKKEIESVSSDNDGYPKIEDFDGDYARYKQAIIDYDNAKTKAVKDALDTAEKGVVKGTEDNNDIKKAVEARLKELMGKYDEAAKVIEDNYKVLNNAPKIFPYFDMFTTDQVQLARSDDGDHSTAIIESICKDLYRHYDKTNPGSAVSIASAYIADIEELNGRLERSLMIKDGKLDRTALSKSVPSKTTLDETDKNCIIAGCFKDAKSSTYAIMPSGYIDTAKNIQAKLSLEYFYKGASVNDGLVGTPSEQLFSSFSITEVKTFLKNIELCKRSSNYNDFGVLSSINKTLRTLDDGENRLIQRSYALSNSVNSMKLEEVDKNFMITSVIPTLQKTVCNVVSFCAQIISEVYSTRLKVCTEAYNAGNRIYDEILRLCVTNEVYINSNKK